MLHEKHELALIAVYQQAPVIYVLCYYQKINFLMKTYKTAIKTQLSTKRASYERQKQAEKKYNK